MGEQSGGAFWTSIITDRVPFSYLTRAALPSVFAYRWTSALLTPGAVLPSMLAYRWTAAHRDMSTCVGDLLKMESAGVVSPGGCGPHRDGWSPPRRNKCERGRVADPRLVYYEPPQSTQMITSEVRFTVGPPATDSHSHSPMPQSISSLDLLPCTTRTRYSLGACSGSTSSKMGGD